jgi:hypothetical protein
LKGKFSMTVTIVQNNSHDKSALLVQAAAKVTALAAATPSASQSQALRQAQEELVRGCFDARRLDPAAVISTQGASVFSTAWLAKYHPEIAALTAQSTTQKVTAGDVSDQLRISQIRAVDDAMAQGITSAASILSTMT